jgi:hypothetical protein
MKKLLLVLMSLALAGGLVGSAFALLGDTETSTGNIYTAGTLNLTVDGRDDANVQHVIMDKVYPHGADYTYQNFNHQWVVKNEGNLPGTFWVEIKNIQNLENDISEPEVDAGDTTPDVGELGGLTWVKFSENDWGDPYPSLGWVGSTQFNPFNTALNMPSSSVVIPPGSSMKVYMWFDWPSHDGYYGIDNTAQGDSLQFDIVFHLEQSITNGSGGSPTVAP